MKKSIKPALFFLTLGVLLGCKLKEQSNQTPEFVDFLVTDARETRQVALSTLLESCEMVVFENRDEAIFGGKNITISDNYLLVPPSNQQPYKLFDKQGTFLNYVGNIGQGPGEYHFTRDELIDEVNGKIYIAPFAFSSHILVYDLDGTFDRAIELGEKLNKPRIGFLPNGNLFVIHLPFEGDESTRTHIFAFELTPAGEIIKEIRTKEEDLIRANFDHELFNYSNSSGFTYALSASDTLMTYDWVKKELKPVFHIRFPSEKRPMALYNEIPAYYLVNIYDWDDHARRMVFNKKVAVEKNTGKGSVIEIRNDCFGNIETSAWFAKGYYSEIMEPYELIEKIEKRLKEKDCTNAREREQLIKLRDSMDEDGNNILFYGKLK